MCPTELKPWGGAGGDWTVVTLLRGAVRGPGPASPERSEHMTVMLLLSNFKRNVVLCQFLQSLQCS